MLFIHMASTKSLDIDIDLYLKTVASILLCAIFVAPAAASDGQPCDRKQYEKDFPCWLPQYLDFKTGFKCLRFINDTSTATIARKGCQDAKGEMLQIRTQRENDALAVEFDMMKEHEFWIGLMRVDAGSDSFEWTETKKRNRWSNWAPEHPKPKTGQDCVKRRRDGLWETASCSERLPYICQTYSGRKLRPPRMTTKFHKGSNVMSNKQPAVFSCQAFVGDTGSLSIYLQPGEGNEMIQKVVESRMNMKKQLVVSDKQYVMDGDRCGQLVGATLTMMPRQVWSGSRPICCSQHPHLQDQSCSVGPVITVKHNPLTPDLRIRYEIFGEQFVMEASCKAFVGTGGKLSWLLRSRYSTTTVWSIDLNGNIEKEGPFNADVTVLTPVKDGVKEHIFGPSVRSVFKAAVSEFPSNSALSCLSIEVKDLDKIPKDVIFTENIVDNIYAPSPPRLHLLQTGRQVVIPKGEQLQINCTAFVGSFGGLTWTISTPKVNRTWTISFTNLQGRHLPLPRYINISYTKDTDDLWGPRINSTLTLAADKSLEGATVKCYSYDRRGMASGTFSRLVNNMSNLEMAVEALRVQNVGEAPRLKINVHQDPNVFFSDLPGSVECVADVGEHGSLHWFLNSLNTEYTWEVNNEGVSGPGAPHFFNTNAIIEESADQPGTTINSTLFFSAGRWLDHAVFRCHSHNSTGTELDVYSKEECIRVVYIVKETARSRSSPTVSTGAFLGTGIFIVICVIGAIALFLRARGRREPIERGGG